MTNWTRWSTGLLFGGVASLATAGCLEEDPNMDGNTTDGSDSTAGTSNGPSNGPGGSADDNTSGGTADETDSGPGVTTDAEEVTIYDIQMGSVPDGTVVTLNDVIVTSPVQVEDGGVTVQDPKGGQFSGIYLFLFADVVTGVPLSPGDIVTVTGEYSEFFDFSQITITAVESLSVTGSTDVPDPITVEPSEIATGSDTAEAYESVLVRVENVTASEGTNNFGDFPVDDGLIISNFWLFEQGGQLDVLPGTELGFAQGPLLYNFEEFKLAPRTDADYDATLVDCAEAATPATIFDIQQGMVAPGTLVNIEDVVVTTPWTFNGEGFWVQEPTGGEFSGLSVFAPNAEGFTPMPGMQVSLCGAYDEFFDQSQLQIASASDIMAGASGPAPAPEVLSSDVVGGGAMAEAWEGVLVQVDNASVTMEANEFGEWQVDDTLLLDDAFFEMASWPNPAVDDVYTSITGVMSYSFDNYKLAPRDAADFVPAP